MASFWALVIQALATSLQEVSPQVCSSLHDKSATKLLVTSPRIPFNKGTHASVQQEHGVSHLCTLQQGVSRAPLGSPIVMAMTFYWQRFVLFNRRVSVEVTVNRLILSNLLSYIQRCCW